MNARWETQRKGVESALKALYSPPMTDEERREHERLIARQIARDEAARRDSPQMELDA